jgi:hypothetical protein
MKVNAPILALRAEEFDPSENDPKHKGLVSERERG